MRKITIDNAMHNHFGVILKNTEKKASNKIKAKNRVGKKITFLSLLIFSIGLTASAESHAQTEIKLFNKPQIIIREASVLNNNQIIISGYTKTCNSSLLINEEVVNLTRLAHSSYCSFLYQRFDDADVYKLKADNDRDGIYEYSEVIDFSVRRNVGQVGALYLPPASFSAASNLLMNEVSEGVNKGLASLWRPLKVKDQQRIGFSGFQGSIHGEAGINNINVTGKVAPKAGSNNDIYLSRLLKYLPRSQPPEVFIR